MYENEADKETMLVTIGEYKDLVRKAAEISVVAAILKSSSEKALASCIISSLSLSATVKSTHPFVGTLIPDPTIAL